MKAAVFAVAALAATLAMGAAKDVLAPIAKIDTAIASLRATKNMTLGGSAFVLQPAPVGGGSGQLTGDILCLVNGDGIVAGIASANGNYACATAADAASAVTIPVGSGFISGLWIGIAKSGPPSIGKLVFEVTPPGGGPLDAKKYECGTAGWPAAPLFTSIELFAAGDIKTGCSTAGSASGRRLSQATRVLDASRLTVFATPAPQTADAPTPPTLNSVPLAGVLTPDQLAEVEAANADPVTDPATSAAGATGATGPPGPPGPPGQNGEAMPPGAVIMFSGTVPPSGWALCDGQNGTPDLRDRFVVGAGLGYSVGSTGGASSVTLGIGEIPSHRHSYLTADVINRDVGISLTTINIGSSSSRFQDVTDATGGGTSHENRPPYYALTYIIKM